MIVRSLIDGTTFVATMSLLVCTTSACMSKDDEVLIAKDGVSIVWRTEKTWRGKGGHDPIPERVTRQKQLMLWGDDEVPLWDYVDRPTSYWTREDELELEVHDAFALYQRNGGGWWAVYKGPAALFHGPKPVEPGAVPDLATVRPELFARQLARGLRAKIVANARAESEAAVVDLLSKTVGVRAHRGDKDWVAARDTLSEDGRGKVDEALLTAYRERPSTFVILRASRHLDLSSPELDEPNRAALRELDRAAAVQDSWGEHHTAAELLPKLACRKAFADEREVVFSVRCR